VSERKVDGILDTLLRDPRELLEASSREPFQHMSDYEKVSESSERTLQN
jgi:hypothetical protein